MGNVWIQQNAWRFSINFVFRNIFCFGTKFECAHSTLSCGLSYPLSKEERKTMLCVSEWVQMTFNNPNSLSFNRRWLFVRSLNGEFRWEEDSIGTADERWHIRNANELKENQLFLCVRTWIWSNCFFVGEGLYPSHRKRIELRKTAKKWERESMSTRVPCNDNVNLIWFSNSTAAHCTKWK